MSPPARWRRPLLFVLLLLALFYSTYFVSRYAIASLVTDHQSVVIAELIRSQLARRSPLLMSQILSPRARPSIADRCSFFLLEEIWRDCKSIVLVPNESRSKRPELEQAITEAARVVVADPCAHFTDATVIHGIDRRRFGCDGKPSPFRATVRYVPSGESGFEITLKGNIE